MAGICQALPETWLWKLAFMRTNRKCILQVAVIVPLADQEGFFSIPQIMRCHNGESAHRINRALDRRGGVWQHESFDHGLWNDENLASKMA